MTLRFFDRGHGRWHHGVSEVGMFRVAAARHTPRRGASEQRRRRRAAGSDANGREDS